MLFRSLVTKHLPATVLQIDPSHPLAQGLISCYVPGVMGGIDLVGGLDLTLANCYPDISQEGPVLSTLTTGFAGPSYPSVPLDHPWRSFTSLTMYWRGVPPPSGGGLALFPSRVFALEYGGSDNSPYFVAGFYVSTQTDPAVFQTAWNTAGVFTVAAVGSGSVAFNRLPFSVAASFVVNGNVVSYLNGVPYDTTAFGAGAPTYAVDSTLDLTGENNVGASGLASTIACAWNRALSTAEIAALDADPYCFLMPAEGAMPALVAAAAAAGTSFSAFSIPQLDGRTITRMIGY